MAYKWCPSRIIILIIRRLTYSRTFRDELKPKVQCRDTVYQQHVVKREEEPCAQSRIGNRQFSSTLYIRKQTCGHERERSRVRSLVAIVSMLINDALDAREQTSYTRIRTTVVVIVVVVERKNINR